MFGTRKQWIQVFFWAGMVCLSFSFTKTFAFSASSFPGLLTTISNTEVQNFQVKKIITSYCTEVLAAPAFVENGFLYTAQQSAFVYLLCKNIGIPSSSFTYFTKEKDYFKRLSFQELGFQDITTDQIDLCAPDSFSNDCDLATHVPKLFNGIMNDYINMKQPNLYGMNANFNNDEKKMIDQINDFSSGYFDGIQVCETRTRSYPKTCSMMKGYMRNVSNILSDVRIFNASGILATPSVCGNIYLTGDVFSCGLYGEKSSKLSSFVNLSYNELLYYRLFMGYYLTMIQKYPQLLLRNTYITEYTSILKTFSTQYMRSKDALSLSFRMMRDTSMAFPFHIGFSMYQEDLDGFGKALARIAPPIYTLYDKLRNVQKPQ